MYLESGCWCFVEMDMVEDRETGTWSGTTLYADMLYCMLSAPRVEFMHREYL